MTKTIRLLFLSLIFSQASFSQTWQDTLLAINKTLDQYKSANPGCQLSIERNGTIIFTKAVGMADLERMVPLTTYSVIEAGSVSKQFTAAAILLLEQQGKLSLADDVRKYIPELPNYGTPIKLHHMLHHTSGLRDWGAVIALSGWPRSSKFYTNADALEIISRQKNLNNTPGDEYIYSNSGFNLFAIIVQRVSGLSLADFTRKYIFKPAGMTHTQWRDDPNRIVLNRAIAYSKTDSGYTTDMPNEYVYGNGGLLTTTEDLLKWSDFYQQGKLGTSSLLARQLQTEPLHNGTKNDYAAGLVIKKVRGWDNISHSGSTAGYRANLETYPEAKFSIAILSNNSEFSLQSLSDKIGKIFLNDKMPVITAAIKPKDEPSLVGFNLSSGELKRYEGNYFSEETNSTATVLLKDGLLMIRLNANTIYTLQPASKDAFQIKEAGAGLEFSKNKNGNIDAFEVSVARARNVQFRKIN